MRIIALLIIVSILGGCVTTPLTPEDKDRFEQEKERFERERQIPREPNRPRI